MPHQAKAINAAIQPKTGTFQNGRLHIRIVQIEIGLFAQEIVQIILLAVAIPCPCRAFEQGLPIIGRAAIGFWIGPHIPIGLGVCAARTAFHEPRMLIGAVGIDLIDDQLQAQLMGFFQDRIEIFQGAENGVHIAVIGNVIAIIPHWRGEKRGYPDPVRAQIRNMVQML